MNTVLHNSRHYKLHASKPDFPDLPMLAPKLVRESDYPLSNESLKPDFVLDQGNIGSCGANMSAYSLYIFFKAHRYGFQGTASRLGIYKAARNEMHVTGDTGVNNNYLFKALRDYGVWPEAMQPYDVDAYDDPIPANCLAYGLNWQTTGFTRISGKWAGQWTRTAKRVAFKAAINDSRPCNGGIAVYSSFMNTGKDGIVPEPDGELEGYHDICQYGYNETGVCFMNSWGSDWGNGGAGIIPWSVYYRIASDTWTLDMTENGA